MNFLLSNFFIMNSIYLFDYLIIILSLVFVYRLIKFKAKAGD